MPRWLYFFLVFTVLTLILDFLHVPPLVLFIIAALGYCSASGVNWRVG